MSGFDRITELTATPIIITANMDESEFAHEFGLMMTRSQAAAALVAGEIRIDDYLDTIAECGVDVDEALDCWTEGYSLMGN
jgi:hypothetical protein